MVLHSRATEAKKNRSSSDSAWSLLLCVQIIRDKILRQCSRQLAELSVRRRKDRVQTNQRMNGAAEEDIKYKDKSGDTFRVEKITVN